MNKLIKKAKPGIKFDSNQRYVNKHNKQFGSGVWYRDNNDNGYYDKGEQLIKPGNRIRNSDGSYMQLNSNGTTTTLFKNNKFTEAGQQLNNIDKIAIKNRLIYGKKATNNGGVFRRTSSGKNQWDIDTDRKQYKGYQMDINGNTITPDNTINSASNIEVINPINNTYSNDAGIHMHNIYVKRHLNNKPKNNQTINNKNTKTNNSSSSAWNTFKNGWKGVGNDLNNLVHRPLTFPGITGFFGDIGRGVQHVAQGTIGAASEAILPDAVNNFIGKYGQIADLGKDLRSITSGISSLTGNDKFVTPWDIENNGLADYSSDPITKQQFQDINDVINGTTILAGAKGAGSMKGAIKNTTTRTANTAKTAAKSFGVRLKQGTQKVNNVIKKIAEPYIDFWYGPGIGNASRISSGKIRINNNPIDYDAEIPNSHILRVGKPVEVTYGTTAPVDVFNQTAKRIYAKPSNEIAPTVSPVVDLETSVVPDFSSYKYNGRYIQPTDGHSIIYQQPSTVQSPTAGIDVFNQTAANLQTPKKSVSISNSKRNSLRYNNINKTNKRKTLADRRISKHYYGGELFYFSTHLIPRNN